MMTIDDSKSCTFSVRGERFTQKKKKILRFTVHPVVTWQSGLCATLDFLVDQWCWSGWDSIEFSFRISFDSAMCFFLFVPFLRSLSYVFMLLSYCCPTTSRALAVFCILVCDSWRTNRPLFGFNWGEFFLYYSDNGRKESNQSRLCVQTLNED